MGTEAKKIKKIIEIYDNYLDDKKNLLNHPCVMEYLFNKPIGHFDCLKDLISDYDCTVKRIYLNNKDIDTISTRTLTMMNLLVDYSKKMDKYTNLKNLSKVNYFRTISSLSPKEQDIMDIIYDLPYQMNFIYKWSFNIEGKHNSVMKVPSVNFDQEIKCDFLCFLIHNNKLIIFAIQYDKDDKKTVARNIYLNDMFKQYCLFQMNVHLLRLNRTHDFKKEIRYFVKKVINTNDYQIRHGMKPDLEILDNDKEIKNLLTFKKDYQYNHIAYLKIPCQKNYNDIQIDDDTIDTTYIEGHGDTSYVISNTLVKKVLKEKEDLHPPKKENIKINRNDMDMLDMVDIFLARAKKKN